MCVRERYKILQSEMPQDLVMDSSGRLKDGYL